MMQLKVEKIEIIEEREKQLRKLEEITGRKEKRKPIPDYVTENQKKDSVAEEKLEEEEDV